VTAVLAGCGTPPVTVPPPVPATSAPTSAAFGGTDRSWLEINIAMDEELLPLLDLAATRGGDTALQQLADQVKVVIDEELGTLRQLHADAGLPAENPHKGMPMPGMVTPSQVAEAGRQRGADFDETLRDCLRAHLEQSRQLAGSERTAGSEPRTVALADRIFTSREEFLKSLDS
jgi:hypothetical protein